MPKLAEIQKTFIAAITDSSLIDALNITNSKLFNIYRNSIIFKHAEVLKAAYPITLQLVGEVFFNTAAYFYRQSFPAISNNFNLYGDNFNFFLKSYRPTKKLTYLPEIAQLEWAYHITHYAEKSRGFNPVELAMISEFEYGDIVFQLQPSCQLLKFEHSIYELWQTCQTVAEIDLIELKQTEQYLIILSVNDDIIIERLTRAEFTLLDQFSNDVSLQEASREILIIEHEFDLTACLQNFILKRYISGFKILNRHQTDNEKP